FSQCGFVLFIYCDKGAGNPETNGFCLTFNTTTLDVDCNIVLRLCVDSRKCLQYSGLVDFRQEVILEATVVYGDITFSRFEINPGNGGLPSTDSVENLHLSEFNFLGLLCLMGVLRTFIYMEVAEKFTTQAIFRQHAAHRVLDQPLGIFAVNQRR